MQGGLDFCHGHFGFQKNAIQLLIKIGADQPLSRAAIADVAQALAQAEKEGEIKGAERVQVAIEQAMADHKDILPLPDTEFISEAAQAELDLILRGK